jgi:hypothetical protein
MAHHLEDLDLSGPPYGYAPAIEELSAESYVYLHAPTHDAGRACNVALTVRDFDRDMLAREIARTDELGRSVGIVNAYERGYRIEIEGERAGPSLTYRWAVLSEAVPEDAEPPICRCGRHYEGASCPEETDR